MKNLKLIALAIPLLLFVSCQKEEFIPTSSQNFSLNYSLQTTLDFLAAENDFSLFHDAIIQSKMDIEIDGNGPYTVFAPDNNAMEKFLKKNNWKKIQDIPVSTLTLMVQFHISKRDVKIADLNKGKYVPILYKERELFIDIDNPSEPFLILGITKANVLNKDNAQRNGMVNKIDNVLSL